MLTVGHYLPEWFDEGGVEVLAAEVGLADAALAHELLQQQVVGGGGVVVPVGLDALAGEAVVEAQLDRRLEDLLVDGNAVVTDNQALRTGLRRSRVPPPVLADVLDPVPLDGVDGEDVGKHVLGVLGERLGDLVLAGEDLLVELGGLGVFEGQAAAEHRVEDDAAAPDVHHDGLVAVLALDHLGRGVAGRPAGSLEALLCIGGALPLR